jgi:FAD/FMN-containing dehydrogenase
MVVHSSSPVQSALLTDPAVLEGYRQDASSYRGAPEGLLRPADAGEAAAALAEASSLGVSVTPCGLRSSLTGSGVAERGWAMSLERMTGLLDLDRARRRAVVAAGTVLREFKDQVEAEGFFYPPDPTSERECSVGGTVACDASGARTYRYGATHRWVRGVEVALPDGSVRWFRRRETDKDAAGMAGLRDLVGLFCGSEGTLGVVTKVELALVPRPEAFLGGLAFFRDVAAALGFVGAAREEDGRGGGEPRPDGVRPRCLELLDGACLEIMRRQGSGLVMPEAARAAVFFEQEHEAGGDSAVVERWWSLLSRSPGALADDTAIATDRGRQDELRRLRHSVPATLNEEGARAMPRGGRKISTDWAVPFAELPGLIRQSDEWLRAANISRIARYGHVGNGHPHYNLVVEDTDEAARATAVVQRMCEEACRLGGTVTAEHGIGKLKRPFVRYRWTELELEAMRAVKRVFDPKGILAPGNLFPDES